MTRHKLVLAPSASDDLVELVDSLRATAGLELALATNARLEAALASLEQHPARGRVVPELRDRGVTAYRELVAAPYRIIYRVDKHEVWVVAIVDHRRDLDVLLATRARRS